MKKYEEVRNIENKFKTFQHLKSYLKIVAKNSGNDINIDNFKGLEKIYDYISLNKGLIKYDFNFSEWIKLIRENDQTTLIHISLYGENITSTTQILDIRQNCGLNFIIKKSFPNMICTYTHPNMNSDIGCYFIYDKTGELVYIGKSTNSLIQRACSSALQKTCGVFSKIELLEFSTKAETNIFEIYYISKYKPLLNIESNSNDKLSFDLPDTSLSRKTILPVETVYFDDMNSQDCQSYQEEMINKGYINYVIKNGRAFRPIIPKSRNAIKNI